MELSILRFIQSGANGFWDVLFQAVTILGESAAALAVITWVYWCHDKRLGKQVCFALLFSLACNGVVKDLFRMPRPIGQPGIRTLRAHTATGYSFPSGHTQTLSTLWAALAFRLRRPWLWAVAVIGSLLVAYSRLYLGVHYPKDVAAGLALGFLIAWGVSFLWDRVSRPGTLCGAAAFLCLPGLLAAPSRDYLLTCALLWGFFLGSLLEERFVRFTAPLSPRGKFFRWTAGLVLVGALAAGLKALLPESGLFTFLRYFLLSFAGIGLYPLLFQKLGF